jgi:hypothetical protein
MEACIASTLKNFEGNAINGSGYVTERLSKQMKPLPNNYKGKHV